jgi:hypothetical protein
MEKLRTIGKHNFHQFKGRTGMWRANVVPMLLARYEVDNGSPAC